MSIFDKLKTMFGPKREAGDINDPLSTSEENIVASIISSLKEQDPLIRAISIGLAGHLKNKDFVDHSEVLHLTLKGEIERFLRRFVETNSAEYIPVPALIKALEDPSEDVKVTVAGVLGFLKDRTAVPALINTLNDKSAHTRMKAAISLGYIRDTKAIPALSNATKDENEFVRKYACEALGNIGRDAVPALLEAMKDNRLRDTATNALLKIK